MFDDNDGFDLCDLKRRLSNIVRIGSVFSVDYKKAVARVKIGELETGWLPWILRDGKDKIWHGLDIDEQVLVLSPSGELEQGIIIPSLPKETISDNKDTLYIRFLDNSEIIFDRSTGNLTASVTGDAFVKSEKNILADAKIAAIVKAPNITLDGDVHITKTLVVDGNVDLAGGGPAVARVGDKVAVDATTHQGTIQGGSGKVKAG